MQDDSVVTYGVVDGFWATIQTTTFFEETFGHKGLRNQGPDTITSYMFPLEAPLATAFWDGKSIYYGTGDKDQQGPFTSMTMISGLTWTMWSMPLTVPPLICVLACIPGQDFITKRAL